MKHLHTRNQAQGSLVHLMLTSSHTSQKRSGLRVVTCKAARSQMRFRTVLAPRLHRQLAAGAWAHASLAISAKTNLVIGWAPRGAISCRFKSIYVQCILMRAPSRPTSTWPTHNRLYRVKCSWPAQDLHSLVNRDRACYNPNSTTSYQP